MRVLFYILVALLVEVALCTDDYCPPGLYYPDSEDCTKFYQCDNGYPVAKWCGPGTVFSRRFNVCVHPNDVDCPEKADILNLCEPDGAYIFYPNDCRVFSICERGVPVLQECPDGTLFNPGSMECDSSYECKPDYYIPYTSEERTQ